jgi:hypothetical protein
MTTLTAHEINHIRTKGALPGSQLWLSYNDKGLTISSVSVQGLLIDDKTSPLDGTVKHALLFRNVTFTEDVVIDSRTLRSRLYFENCTFLKKVRITNYAVNIAFWGENVIKDTCLFEVNNINAGEVIIENFKLEGKLFITGENKRISLVRKITSTGTGMLIIGHGEFYQTYLSDITVDSLYIGKFDDISGSGQCWLKNETVIENCTVQNIFRINVAQIDLVFRIKLCIINDFKLSNLVEPGHKLEITETSFSKLELQLGQLNQILIANCFELKNLEFTETNKAEQIVKIENTTILENVLLNRISNKGNITFSELYVPKSSKLSLIASDLGKTDFLNCKFRQAHFEFQNSKLTEIFIAGTTIFPNKVLNNGVYDSRQSRLAYGELHTACQKQGDTTGQLMYQSKEIAAHYDCLAWKSKDFFSKFTLLLNMISNDFGRNWVLGIGFTLGIGYIFFTALLASTKEYEYGWHWGGFPSDLIPAFLKFINPLRFFDTDSLFDIGGSKKVGRLPPGSYIIDSLGRVLLAYGIYQTIQAFRRFGRK